MPSRNSIAVGTSHFMIAFSIRFKIQTVSMSPSAFSGKTARFPPSGRPLAAISYTRGTDRRTRVPPLCPGATLTVVPIRAAR
jgi:hypothetical protein